LLGVAWRGGERPIELAAGQRHIAAIEDRSDRDLGGIDRTAAAETDHRVGIVPAQLLSKRAHRRHRNMLRNSLEHARTARPHGGRHLFE